MGKNGSRQVVVNSHGKEMGQQKEEKPAEAGKQLKLTIDVDLQIAAEQALDGRNGAMVALDPRTGEILAMVSRPTYDPNNFAVRIKKDEWSKLVNDDDHPLLNKAIQAQLAPGSVFKIIMATAGLQEGIAQEMKVTCNGGASFYGRYFKCWVVAEHRVHGVVAVTPIQLARAIGAIASGGVLRRPHITNPTDLPPNVIPASTPSDEVKVSIDPKNWEIITDAMANVVNPGGTAALSHLQGIDFAGKTGSAQTISNALKAKLGAMGKSKFKDNGWFAGVEPRRNPEIVVCALLEEGEHGYLAARTAAQVIKAYVEKQRRTPSKMAKSDGKVEIGALWNAADTDGDEALQGGRFVMEIPEKHAPLAVAAPGFN